VVVCPNGDLLAVWFHGSGERKADDVQILGSRLRPGGCAWEPVFPVADEPGYPDCNPVLFVDARERLRLFWVTVMAHRWECSLLRSCWSEDYQREGPPRWSWQDVILLDPGEEFADVMAARFEELRYERPQPWSGYAPTYETQIIEAARDPWKRQTGWMTRIHPLVLRSGRVLLPLYSDGFNCGLVALSDDGGETWCAGGPIVGYVPVQPSLVELEDGRVRAYLRNNGGRPPRILMSESADGGQTWSAAQPTAFPNPGASVEILRLRNGAWLLVFNDSESGRRSLCAALSSNEGRTWCVRTVIEQGEGSYSYPSVVEDPQGLVHVVYSSHTQCGNTIQHAVLATTDDPA
jgi:predicted neuraminidase